MTVICEPCAGLGHHTSFLCGPADPEAPLTGEMTCDVSRSVCSTCGGFGRLGEAGRRRHNANLAAEDTRISSINALARARRSWQLGKRP